MKKGHRESVQAAMVFLLGLAFLVLVLQFYDNVHRGTTNGLWKSIAVETWVNHAPERRTEASNILYFPVVGALVRALPASVFGPVWRRMAFVNVLFAAFALSMTFLLALRLFESPAAAAFTCALQGACGFFLLLSTINEDIMPGYAWFAAAITCSVLAAGRSTWVARVVIAQCAASPGCFIRRCSCPSLVRSC
jgi:hypothetical protein